MATLRQPSESELLALVEASGAMVETVRAYLRGDPIDPRREPPLRRAVIRLGWQLVPPGSIVDTTRDG